MENTVRKYDFDNVEKISGVEFKWSMAATAIVIIHLWGWLSLGPFIFTILSLFSWWSFRRYFTRVGDTVTSRLVSLVMLVIAVYGVATVLLRSIFSIEFLIGLGDSEIVITLFKITFYLICALSVLVLVGCIRIIAANKGHSFPLKRIAVSTAVSIPIFIIFGVIGSLTFMSQAGEILSGLSGSDPFESELYTDGINYYKDLNLAEGSGDALESIMGDLWGVVAFILAPFILTYKVIVILPYVFLLIHFYKMDKRNSIKSDVINTHSGKKEDILDSSGISQ